MKTGTEKITIDDTQAGKRLDRFLADLDMDTSRAAWQKMIKKGCVLVNGEPAENNQKLKRGDIIGISPEEATERKKAEVPDIRIIYEDEDVIVIDKPIGVLAQGAASSSAPSVTDFLEDHFPPIREIGEEEQRSGIVHRLDKDTSGIMIAAKNQAAFEFLKDKFKTREVEKIYTTLVYGRVEPSKGEINLAIGRNPKAPCRQTVVKDPQISDIKSRPARTIYSTLKNLEGFSLLRIELKTGRMHQIRVHMKAVGHPVAGDPKYSPKSLLGTTPELRRQFLHASELRLRLPSGQEKAFSSPLPADLESFLKKLE